MKNLQKFFLVSFLIGGMLTSAMFTQGQAAKSKVKSVDYPPSQAYISAGEDASICNVAKFVTQGTWKSANDIAGNTIWKTSGDGTFIHPYSLHALYIPGKQDIKNGKVLLTMTFVSSGVFSTILYMDSMVLHLNTCGNYYDDPKQ